MKKNKIKLIKKSKFQKKINTIQSQNKNKIF